MKMAPSKILGADALKLGGIGERSLSLANEVAHLFALGLEVARIGRFGGNLG
ncbi:hypothetical protein BDD14_1711 [Edaphobacter modestus]|uniref:Uncharacterized protein n=1 Tax=Edaphobacter modestus TaxID=388466 RepID=A0A4Q7YTN3_9BACT|nr:hypothetical protein BDD14_1711 [Edaphobacter modestus]